MSSGVLLDQRIDSLRQFSEVHPVDGYQDSQFCSGLDYLQESISDENIQV